MVNSFNTDIQILDDVVIKTTKRSYDDTQALEIIDNFIAYHEVFASEPIAVPPLHSVERVSDNGLSKIRIITERNRDENLQQARTDSENYIALAITLRSLALMRSDQAGRLQTPIDAAGPNFHISQNEQLVTLVDTFPPLFRLADGSIPYRHIQYSGLPLRQRHIEYYRGTRVGAIIRTLSTVVLGYSPLRQLSSVSYKELSWCHDLIPPNLPGQEQDEIHAAIKNRFIGHVLRAGISDMLCYGALKTGLNP